MSEPSLPENESARLAALQRYQIVDTPPEPAFDDLARLITRICQAPMALISFIDGERQWFKASIGFKSSSLPRSASFCAHALLQNDVLIVRDTQADSRFADNALVVSAPGIRFYAGAALLTPDGFAIGALSIFDLAPRDLTPQQTDAMRVLARQVMALLALRQTELALRQAEATLQQTALTLQQAEQARHQAEAALSEAEAARGELAQAAAERSRQEADRRQSGDRYRQWVESARQGVWVIDANERTTFVNPRLGELLGYTVGEMLGAPLSSFIDEADQDALAASLGQVREGPGATYDLRLKRKDGGDVWAIVATTPVADPAGGDAGALSIVTDITEQRRASQALQESEERFRQLADSLRQVFWVSSADRTRLFYISPACEALWGQSAQSLYDDPTSFIQAVHPDDQPRLIESLREAPQEGVLEYRVVLPDGTVRWLWSHVFPVRDPAGEVYRLAGLTEDVTERKEAEAALQRNEVERRALLEAIPDLVFRFDAEGRYIDFQSAAENRRELLLSPDAFLGRHYRDVLPAEVAQVIDQAFERARAEQSIQTYEYNLTLPNGETHSYEGRLSLDATGNSLSIVRNITRRKRAEAGLEAQKRLFQNLVAIAQATVALPALDATLQNVLDVSVAVTGSSRGLLFVFDTNGRVTGSLSSTSEKREGGEGPSVSLLLEKGLEGQVLRERRPIVVQDARDYENWVPLTGPEGAFASALSLPIEYGESLVGILTLLHEQTAYFTDAHLNLMEAAADQMALVLRNAQIFEQTRRQAQELFMLNSITRAAIESSGPGELLQTLADHMGELIGADGCFITLWDPVERRPIPKAASGMLRVDEESMHVEPGEVTLTASVLDAGHALIAEDVLDTPYLSRRIAEQTPARSLLGLPLIARDQKLGAVLLGFKERRTFTPEEVAFCEQAAVQMALALSNAMLYQVIGEERSRLHEIIEASRDGILLIGVHQRLLVCNNITLQMLGVRGQPEDWIGKTVLEVLSTLRRAAPSAAQATLSEARRTQGDDPSPGEGEFELHGRILHWHHLPVRARGVLLGRLVVMHDVTEERSLERVRNDLTHMMVHDLRSPLTAIIGAADALNDTAAGLTPGDHSTLDLIRDGAERMINLVNDILDVSQLESNRMPIERQAVDLPMLIVETLQLYIGQIEKKQIRLMNDSQANLPPVDADSRLIERVIQNLLSNAVKYTPEGGALRITVGPVDAPRPMLMVSVSDTGPGIPPEIQSRVFEKFVRGDHKEHGSGLGLAFCRLAVEAHGGRLWVESEPGAGSTFRFTLPLYETAG